MFFFLSLVLLCASLTIIMITIIMIIMMIMVAVFFFTSYVALLRQIWPLARGQSLAPNVIHSVAEWSLRNS